MASVVSFQVISPAISYGKDDEDAIRKRLEDLQRKKIDLEKKIQTTATSGGPKEEDLQQIISRYERLLGSCDTAKSERCPEIEFQLGKLYYDEGKEKFVQAREQYDRDMERWEKTRQGVQPKNPVPDYSKSLNMYRRLVREYPSFKRNDEANYQIGNILELAGDVDSAKSAFLYITDKTPNSLRASSAHFRLANYEYLDRNLSGAMQHLEKVRKDQCDAATWENVMYQKANVNYEKGDFDKAADLFLDYIERCESGEYAKKQYRNEAAEYLSAAYADLPQGVNEAIRAFKKLGGRPYEAQIVYGIGLKNRSHGQFDDAIVSLQTALKQYPYYKDAPVARHSLIECFVVKKKLEDANKEREVLVDEYSPGSTWYSKNSRDKAAVDQSNIYINKSLGNICLYYHAQAQQKKDKAMYQKALKRYTDFFTRFPNDKWKCFEFKFYVAEIYNDLGEFGKAVDNYWFVATEDLTKYPSFIIDVDSLLYDDAKQFEQAKQDAKKRMASISQDDAGYNAIVALDNLRKKKMAQGGLSESQVYGLPETQRMLQYIDEFQKRFSKSPNTPELLSIAGNLHYSGAAYDKAIQAFKYICDSYPNSKVASKAYRMLAMTYAKSGEVDLAMSKYKELLQRTDANTPEYTEVLDLAAAAIFTKAEDLKKANNLVGAADVFKSVVNDFPKSTVGDKGWFEAGVCYEESKNFDQAALTFEQLPARFEKSTLREKSFLRSAENYKKVDKQEAAANAYLKAATTITKADFAIPSLSQASDCYKKLNNFKMAGDMFQVVFKRYPDDARAPQCLYSAGLLYEQGKLYDEAIKCYLTLADKYPKSEYAEEASFSVGLNLENMQRYGDAAAAFSDFAKKFENRNKQIEALFKAGDNYAKVRADKDAETSYLSGTTLYDKFKKQSDAALNAIAAKGYCSLGDLYYSQYSSLRLTGGNEKEVVAKTKDKTELLEKTLKVYAKAIETGVVDWVFKSTYKAGDCFIEMADALRSQTLFGSKEQQFAAKFKIISGIEKYYIKAQEKYVWIINKAFDQNLKNQYVDKSVDMFMKMAYLKGRIFEDIAEIFETAPVPRDLTGQELQDYKDVLKEKSLEARDGATPKYKDAIKAAAEIGIDQSIWLDSIKVRLTDIDPQADELNIKIEPKVQKILGGSSSSSDSSSTSGSSMRDESPKANATSKRGKK
jgi:TolA-binding protein